MSPNARQHDAPQRVILDTDAGYFLDDMWALSLLLRCPELDPRLIVSASRDTVHGARVIARLLEAAGRTDIAVGVGVSQEEAYGAPLWPAADYDLASYAGQVYQDGVGAVIDVIMHSPEPITLISIGPLLNVAEAIRREPAVAERARFVGMQGSIYRGYSHDPLPAAEYNVADNPQDAQAVFAAPWEMTITPLDTCGLVTLLGEKYQTVRTCEDPLIQAVIDDYRVYAQRTGKPSLWETQTPTLFDTVAVYLAFSEQLLVMERLGIRVTDDGYTEVDGQGKMVNCAIRWRDLPAFEDFLVRRLTSGRQE